MCHQQCRNERNFLQENRLMMGSPLAVPVVVQSRPPLKQHSYELPTAASLARRSGNRRSEQPRRSIATANASAEKQIQTDDICDELFLSAALLKCTEHGQSRATQSEGDECGPPAAQQLHLPGEGCLRRTTSNYELGRVAEQRAAGYQSRGQCTLQRLLGGVAGPLPGSELDQMDESWTCAPRKDNAADSSSVGSSHSTLAETPQVRQVAIPDVTDVNQEDPLSARSQASKCSELTSVPAAPSEAERASDTNLEAEDKLQQEQEQELEVEQRILLSESQRTDLIEKARVLRSLLIAEWNRLPLSMFTLRVRNLKRQLEQKLDIVDKDLRVLSQQRVYAKQDSWDSYHGFFC